MLMSWYNDPAKTNAVLSKRSASSFVFFICNMCRVIMQYICVQILLIRYGKSTLHTAGTQGSLTIRSTYVQCSHCSVACSMDVIWPYYDY